MEIICNYEECTACQACRSVCPVNAITMVENSRGFSYPIIDQSKCIDCHKCQRICPSINNSVDFNAPLKTYAGWILDKKNRWFSTSGGASYALSRKVIEEGGVFCGCRWNMNHAEHAITDRKEDLHQFQGSKYTYSDINECYIRILQYLKENRKVYFVGTACQIAGLKAFLVKGYENLVTIDILCHGIPSSKGLRDRIAGVERMHKHGKVVDLRFRDKKIDQYHTCMKYTFEDGFSFYSSEYQDFFFRGFDSNYLLRENCFNCKYARRERISDITIADFWGYSPINLRFRSFRKGTSLLLANTLKGMEVIDQLDAFQKEERDYEYAARAQNNLHKPQQKPDSYNEFWDKYLSADDSVQAFSQLALEYFPPIMPLPIKKNDWRTFKSMIIQKSVKKIIADFIRTYFWWTYRPFKDLRRNVVIYNYRKRQIDRLDKLNASIKHVYYLGITEQPNLGDMAQHYCIKNWITDNYPDYQMVMFESSAITDSHHTKRFFDKLKKKFGQDDRIIIQSGYCTQDLGGDHPLMHRLVCENMPDAKILMMPQTIFFQHEENRRMCAENHNRAKNMLFLARDQYSYKQAIEMFPNIKVKAYPDIVTTLIGTYSFNHERKGVCLCTRNDGEKLYSYEEISELKARIENDDVTVFEKDTQGKRPYQEIRSNLKQFIEQEIESYSYYKVTITDRYHGTIFSLCAGIPVIIIKTTDHKVITGAEWFKGVYDDFVYVAEDLNDAYNICKKVMSLPLSNKLKPYFKEAYYDKLKSLFEDN